MKPLSKSQQAIFNFLKQCADEGRTPSVREICEATGLKSTSTVHHHLSALEEKGLIEHKRVNHCMRIAGEERSVNVPLVGSVAAGYPILAVEEMKTCRCLFPEVLAVAENFLHCM